MALREGRKVETKEYIGMVRRALRAYARRVTEDCGDIESLAHLVDLQAELDAVTVQAIAGLVATGHSWAEIGRVLGVTRQAAQQRYARLQRAQLQADLDYVADAVERAQREAGAA